MQEIWKESSISGYYISNLGKVRGRSGKILKAYNSNGYLQIVVYPEGKNTKFKVLKIHREVAKAFIPNPNNLLQVNHIDGNKLNNSVVNLEWCTNKENTMHAWKQGLAKSIRGINNSQSKLTKEEVKFIHEHYIPRDSKFGCRALARRFNVSHKVISELVRNISYVE